MRQRRGGGGSDRCWPLIRRKEHARAMGQPSRTQRCRCLYFGGVAGEGRERQQQPRPRHFHQRRVHVLYRIAKRAQCRS